MTLPCAREGGARCSFPWLAVAGILYVQDAHGPPAGGAREVSTEKNRNTRQVSYGLWAVAGHTRRISGRLRAQATQLLRDSQALVEERQPRPVQGHTQTRPA